MSIETKDRPDLADLRKLIPKRVALPDGAELLCMHTALKLMQHTAEERWFIFKMILNVETNPPYSHYLDMKNGWRCLGDEADDFLGGNGDGAVDEGARRTYLLFTRTDDEGDFSNEPVCVQEDLLLSAAEIETLRLGIEDLLHPLAGRRVVEKPTREAVAS